MNPLKASSDTLSSKNQKECTTISGKVVFWFAQLRLRNIPLQHSFIEGMATYISLTCSSYALNF